MKRVPTRTEPSAYPACLMVAPETLEPSQLENVCLVVADCIWAKFFHPCDETSQLQLSYHCANFGGSMFDFAADVCARMSWEMREGNYDGLVIWSSPKFLNTLKFHMDTLCRESLLETAILGPRGFSGEAVEARWTQRSAALTADRFFYAG